MVTGEELLKFSVLIRGILAKGINVTAELAAVLMEEYIGKEVSRRTMQRMRLRGLGAKPHARTRELRKLMNFWTVSASNC